MFGSGSSWRPIPHWRYAAVEDVGKVAQDWPDLNFHLYHAGLKMWRDARSVSEEFEQTGLLHENAPQARIWPVARFDGQSTKKQARRSR